MFSSLASFLFGSNTNCETNSETTATAIARGESQQQGDTSVNLLDADNVIEVTSLTPSVTGASDSGQRVTTKSVKNRHNNARQYNKRKGVKAPLPLTPKQTKLPNFSDSCDEEEFDEDDWFIVDKEDEKEEVSSTRSDSEGEIVPVCVATVAKPVKPVAANNLAQQRRLQHINSHSLYSGPRPQKQRNFLQKTRNNTNNRPGNGLSVSTLSPSRTVNDGRTGSGHEPTADAGVTRSLYVVPTVTQQSDEKATDATNGIETINKMEESWFVTPPPCFTSIGPINMETSPYENLFIEHPSMSVYRSIKAAQEAAEGFIKLDIGVNDEAEKQKANKRSSKENSQAVQTRSPYTGYRLDRQTVAQLKQELMARNVQKVQTKKERSDICRSAIKRANKVYDVQSRNRTKRRSDRQHSKIFSNANNNRKSNCC